MVSQENDIVGKVREMYSGHPFPNTSIVNTFWAAPHRAYLLKQGVDVKGLNILEAGCGTGEKLVAHAKTFPQSSFCAIDLTPASIAVAREHLKIFRTSNVREIKQANLMEPIPFPEATFDVIYSIGVIHHTPDPALAMRNLARLLKPGGYMFFWVYGALGQLWRLKKLDYMTLMRKDLDGRPAEMVARDSFREASLLFSIMDRIRGLWKMRNVNYPLLMKSILVAFRRRRAANLVGLDDNNLYDWFLHAHEKFYTGEDVVDDTIKAGLHIEDFIEPCLSLRPRVRNFSRLLKAQWEKLSPFERLQAVDALALPQEYWWVCRKQETEFSRSVPPDYGQTVKIIRTAFNRAL